MSRLIQAIENGNTLEHAAAFAGISYETLRTWMRADEAGDARFDGFAASVREAEAKAAVLSMLIIKKSDEWRAHAWILEHRFPDQYGPKQRTELSGPGGGPIEITAAVRAQANEELDEWRKQQTETLQNLLSVPPT